MYTALCMAVVPRLFRTNRTCSLSDYLNSAVGELFAVFEFSFMVLHERLIHCVDLNYESRGVSLLDAKSYDFICVMAGELSACIVFQFTPIGKSRVSRKLRPRRLRPQTPKSQTPKSQTPKTQTPKTQTLLNLSPFQFFSPK